MVPKAKKTSSKDRGTRGIFQTPRVRDVEDRKIAKWKLGVEKVRRGAGRGLVAWLIEGA